MNTSPDTIQPAGLVVSLDDTHSDKVSPLNKIIASEGASPGFAGGVIILGTGVHTSVFFDCCSGVSCCAQAVKKLPRKKQEKIIFEGVIVILLFEYVVYKTSNG
jgi:hypothetical protein